MITWIEFFPLILITVTYENVLLKALTASEDSETKKYNSCPLPFFLRQSWLSPMIRVCVAYAHALRCGCLLTSMWVGRACGFLVGFHPHTDARLHVWFESWLTLECTIEHQLTLFCLQSAIFGSVLCCTNPPTLILCIINYVFNGTLAIR